MSEPAPDLAALEAALGHRFTDRALLETALVHASHAHESADVASNERLEFLGDAVLDLAVARLLFDAHPDWSEGELTRTRAGLVNRSALATCARQIGLGPHLRLGRTERTSSGAEKGTILADAFEAVLGALYLDAGIAPVVALVERLQGEAIHREAQRDPKTLFQEWAHARLRETPSYETLRDSGVDDDAERFTVVVRVAGRVFGEGQGRSKRSAELAAARGALERSACFDG